MSIKQGEYLKNLRNGKGISQDALGEALGISRQSVSKWEQGNSTPDIDNIGKLAEFYGVSIDSIVKGEADEAKENEQTAQSEEAKAVNELIDEFEGKEEPENKKAEERKFDMPLSAPEPSLKEKELLKEQKDEKYILEREKEREERKKGKEKAKLAFPVLSHSCGYCILLNRCISRRKRLENRLDCSFDNSSFFILA
ncbi:MAG: helix-turn-helix domain-containing protein [Eubacterium sp.]